MKITVYQKDQGAHKTTWKEFASYEEEDGYLVNYYGGFISIQKQNSIIFCGGGENFYFIKE